MVFGHLSGKCVHLPDEQEVLGMLEALVKLDKNYR